MASRTYFTCSVQFGHEDIKSTVICLSGLVRLRKQSITVMDVHVPYTEFANQNWDEKQVLHFSEADEGSSIQPIDRGEDILLSPQAS